MPQPPKPEAATRHKVREHFERVSFFEWIRVVRDLCMDPTTKFVGLTLATYATARTGGDAHPGIQELMAATGYGSKTTVTRALQKLRDMGLIHRQFAATKGGRSHLADAYCLTLHNQVRREAGHKPCDCEREDAA